MVRKKIPFGGMRTGRNSMAAGNDQPSPGTTDELHAEVSRLKQELIKARSEGATPEISEAAKAKITTLEAELKEREADLKQLNDVVDRLESDKLDLTEQIDSLQSANPDVQQFVSNYAGDRCVALIPLDHIQDRPTEGDPLTDEDIETLAKSIRDQGLIEPLVLDKEYRPVSGYGRWNALKRLADQDATWFEATFPNGIQAIVCDKSWDEDPYFFDTLMIATQRNQRNRAAGAIRDEQIRTYAKACLAASDEFHYKAGSRARVPEGKQSLVVWIAKVFNVGRSKVTKALSEQANDPKRVDRRKYRTRVTNGIQRLRQDLERLDPGNPILDRFQEILDMIPKHLAEAGPNQEEEQSGGQTARPKA